MWWWWWVRWRWRRRWRRLWWWWRLMTVVLDVSYDSARVFRGRLWDHGKFLFALVGLASLPQGVQFPVLWCTMRDANDEIPL
jgi:hypothetical protein